MEAHLVRLQVNGASHDVAIEPRRTLADVLRHDLGLTGTHVGCEHGICGACTVIVDGAPTRSCLMFGVQADDCVIETVEGLADEHGQLGPLQRAFAEHHALQCGFCTPGFLMLATEFLRTNSDPSEEQVVDLVASNLCRCTGYRPIVDAILAVARTPAEGGRA